MFKYKCYFIVITCHATLLWKHDYDNMSRYIFMITFMIKKLQLVHYFNSIIKLSQAWYHILWNDRLEISILIKQYRGRIDKNFHKIRKHI